MRNLKKFLAVLVVVAMIASSLATAFAAADPSLTAADKAKALGLLKGGTDGVTQEYLDLGATRIQAAIIYLRLVGGQALEDEARAFPVDATTENFADANQVEGDSVNLLAYLKAHPELGWQGDGTNFNPNGKLSGQAIYKVMLTAIGYQQGLDFDYSETIGFARAKGFVTASLNGTQDEITNDQMAAAMMDALDQTVNNKDTTLAEQLVDNGIITADDAALYTSYVAPTPTPAPTAVPLAVDSVSAQTPANLDEFVVKFTTAVDATKLTTLANYLVGGAAPVYAVASTDNTSVTLTANPANVALQQGNIDVKVLAATGIAADTTKTVSKVTDTTLPAVKSVTVKGSKVVTVVFTEPVKAAQASYLGNYTIDGVIYAATNPANASADGKTWSFTVNGTIASTAKALVVSSNVTDFAGLPLAVNSTPIAVTTDTVAPKAVTLVSASQTAVKVKFDKEMATVPVPSITNGTGTPGTPTVDANDATLWTVPFTWNAALTPSGATLTFTNAIDTFGNAATLSVSTGVPTVDTVRPTYKSISQTDDKNLVVKFDKDMQLGVAGNYTLTDKNGGTWVVTPSYNDTTTPLYTDIKLTSGTAFDATLAPYKLVIKGLVDRTPLQNGLLDTTVTSITLSDKTAPLNTPTVLIDNASATAHKIYVTFNKALDSSTVTLANFSYTSTGGNPVVYPLTNLDSTATVGLGGDTKTVVITLPATVNIATSVARVNFAAAIKDTAGNTVAAGSVAIGASIPVAATIQTEKVSGANTIAVTFDNPIDINSVSLNDYSIYSVKGDGTTDVTIVPISKAIDSTGTILTLTTNLNFTTAGKLMVNGTAETVRMVVASNSTADSYGTKINAKAVTDVGDAYAPAQNASVAASAYATGTQEATIRIALTEDLVAALNNVDLNSGVNAGQFFVTINGLAISSANVTAVYSPKASTASGNPEILVDVTGLPVLAGVAAPAYVGKAFEVKFVPSSATTIKDAGTNTLGTFDVIGTMS